MENESFRLLDNALHVFCYIIIRFRPCNILSKKHLPRHVGQLGQLVDSQSRKRIVTVLRPGFFAEPCNFGSQ